MMEAAVDGKTQGLMRERTLVVLLAVSFFPCDFVGC